MDWLLALDLFGVFVFSLSGGFDAVQHKLDILGVMVLAIATAVGGGIMRDVLLGINPPAAFTNETYLLTCIAGGLVVIFFSNRVERHYHWVKNADAIGLGVFAAIGAAKGLEYGLGWVGILMVSAMTATGGGLIRDLLLRQVPMILHSDFYASAAIIGGAVYMLGHFSGIDEQNALLISAASAIAVRFIAMKWNLSLPKITGGAE